MSWHFREIPYECVCGGGRIWGRAGSGGVDGETVQAHILSRGTSLLLLTMANSVAHVMPF